MRFILIAGLCVLTLPFTVNAATTNDASPRIELSGTLERRRDRLVLRAEGDDYELAFDDSALRGFASALAGEDVSVRGYLEMRRTRGGSVPVVRPDYIGRTDEGQAVSTRVPEDEIEEAIDTAYVPGEGSGRVERRKEQIRSSQDGEMRALPWPNYNRVQRRKLQIRERERERDLLGRGTYLTPGGGTVIINNP
ncbi:MAG TPA: hypothetical protein VEK08_04510 [Planctomycetota bacterium]|nr:hypothetical protein [Planctomycetota bacterium]